MPVGQVGLLGCDILRAGGEEACQDGDHRHGAVTEVGGQGEQVDEVGCEAERIRAFQGIEVNPQLLVLTEQGDGLGPNAVSAVVRVECCHCFWTKT